MFQQQVGGFDCDGQPHQKDFCRRKTFESSGHIFPFYNILPTPAVVKIIESFKPVIKWKLSIFI